MGKIRVFIRKLEKAQGDKAMYNIEKDNNKRIRLATDGWLYTKIFDPMMDETPYLMKDAAEEFGFKPPKMEFGREQKQFTNMLNKYGWDMEPEGAGVIIIYKDEC